MEEEQFYEVVPIETMDDLVVPAGPATSEGLSRLRCRLESGGRRRRGRFLLTDQFKVAAQDAGLR